MQRAEKRIVVIGRIEIVKNKICEKYVSELERRRYNNDYNKPVWLTV